MEEYLKIIHKAPRFFVTDRTPMDMFAYTIAEVSMHNTDEAFGEEIVRYCNACTQATLNYFGLVFIVQPLELYERQPDKPPLNMAYQSHIQILIQTIVMNSGIPYLMVPIETVQGRIDTCINSLNAYKMKQKEGLETRNLH